MTNSVDKIKVNATLLELVRGDITRNWRLSYRWSAYYKRV